MIPEGGIKELVTRVLLVSPHLWKAAARRTHGGRELDVLALLRRTPAEWAPPDEPTMAVTEHQFKQIATAKSAAALEAQLRWNSYVILEPIGKGGMGVVFKAWDDEHKRYVALKRPLAGTEMVERLNREAQLLAHITHPNLARLFAHELHGKVPLLVLEFVTGTNLRHVIDAKARAGESVPWRRVAEWASSCSRPSARSTPPP